MLIEEFIPEIDIDLSTQPTGGLLDPFEEDSEEIIGQYYCDKCPRNKKAKKLYVFKTMNGSDNASILCLKHLEEFYNKLGRFIKKEKQK